MSTSLQCSLCGEPDSALYILSGCKHSTVSNMVTKRHNIASRFLLQGVSKGPLGSGLPPWTLAAQLVLLYRTCRSLNTQQIEKRRKRKEKLLRQ
eukprot:962672-Pelagomonas_calceolata.AAC.1